MKTVPCPRPSTSWIHISFALGGLVLLCFSGSGSAFQFQISSSRQATTRSRSYKSLHPSIQSSSTVYKRRPIRRDNRQIHPISTTSTTTTTSSSQLHLTPPTAPQGDLLRTALGAILAAKVSWSGLTKKQSLRVSGAMAAFGVATLSLACSIRSGATLLFFYASSSKLTRMGSARKQTLEEGYKVGGKRGASQVLACSLIGVMAAMARRIWVGADGPLELLLPEGGSLLGNQLTLAFVAFFACCAGDTWASELGVLSKTNPRLVIKPWKQVAPGTNGGVSTVGLLASAAGGLAMGLCHGLLLPLQFTSWKQRLQEIWMLSIVGLLGGLGGSLLDSVLGATIQITHYDPVEKMILKKPKEGSIKLGVSLLSNEMVNVVSTAATALLVFVFAEPLLTFFC